MKRQQDVKKLSVVIPTFNGRDWLPQTIEKILESLTYAKVQTYEIVVIDDGSTDDTVKVVGQYGKENNLPLKVVSQKNAGRFAARMRGTNEAKYNTLLFVDTRVYIGKKSIDYVLKKQSKDPSRKVWCSHVRVDKTGNIYARFWEAIAFIAWRKYFKNPKDTSYGIEGFDDYPKGTTCFFAEKSVLKEANEWFVKNTKDLKVSNDDTLLIRHIAESNSINISPEYWCTYHARGKLIPYTRHVFHRGKVFVDGFLRNDGNRFFIPLLLFLALTVVAPFILIGMPWLILPALLAGCLLWLLELVAMLMLGVEPRDALSLFLLSPLFAVAYGAGIWRAVLSIYVFNKPRKQEE